MKKYFRYIFIFLMLFSFDNVKATPSNDAFLDDNLYKCIIDAYNNIIDEDKDYNYNISIEELIKIETLDCSNYTGRIKDLTGLNKLTGLKNLNLSGTVITGGALKSGDTISKKSRISLPNGIDITDIKYSVENSKIAKVNNGVVTGLTNGSTTITMTGKISGYEIKEEYLFSSFVNTSSNTRLSSLYLSKGDFKFDTNNRYYTAIVDSSVSSVVVTATLSDKTAKFVSGYGPRTVKLDTGTNTIDVKVQAADGSIGTYTISVIRSDGNDNNNKLANIELTVGKIDFKSDIYSYSFGVASNVNEIDVKAVAESPLAKVTITDIFNNTSENKITSKLKVGTNKIVITVNSESNASQNYQLIITREDYDSEDNYLESLTISNYSINFKRDLYNYDINIGNEKVLNIIPKVEKETSVYSIIGNSDLKDGSKIIVRVSDEEGSAREYNINVHKSGFIELSESLIKWLILGLELIIIIILLIVIICRNSNKPKSPRRSKNKPKSPKKQVNRMGNSSSIICNTCGTVNDVKSKTCYVCGNELR